MNKGTLRGAAGPSLQVARGSAVLSGAPSRLTFAGAGVAAGSADGGNVTLSIPDGYGWLGEEQDYICSPCFGLTTHTFAAGNQGKWARIYISKSCYVSSLRAKVTTSAASSLLYFGVYAEASAGVPGDILTNGASPSVAATGTGVKTASYASGSRPYLAGGSFYMLFIACDVTTVAVQAGTPYIPGQKLGRLDTFPNAESRRDSGYTSGAIPTTGFGIAATDGTQVVMPYIYGVLTQVA